MAELAARAQLLGKIGRSTSTREALVANDFHLNGGQLESVRDYSLALDAPLKSGGPCFRRMPTCIYEPLRTKRLDAAARLSANFRALRSRHRGSLSQAALLGARSPAQTTVDFMGSGRIGDVRFRGVTELRVSPAARLRTAELEAYWSASENVDWDARLAYEATAHRARARLSYVRRLSSLAVALTGEAATDGSVAFGVNLNFSLDPSHRFSSRGGRSRRPERSTPSSIATSTTMASGTRRADREKRDRHHRDPAGRKPTIRTAR